MEVGEGGGGGGRERGRMDEQNSVPSAALLKQQSLAAIGFHGTLFLISTNLFSL